ncbi:MAG: hypothetical protein IT460_17385 [Planctomycetes bacterium]|nr:hypothetical protein [Planctomycetota bacterium]
MPGRRLLSLLLVAATLAGAVGLRAAWGDEKKAPGAGPAAPPAGPAAEGSLLDRARRAAADKDFPEALRLYFAALREAEDYATKYGVRDEVLALPPIPAPPLSPREKGTVAARIAEERARDIDQKAGAMEGKGRILGAMDLWRRLFALEGVTEEKRKQIEGTLERLTRRLCDEATEDEKTEAKALEGDPKDPGAAFARAEQLAATPGKGRVALRLWAYVSYSTFADQALKDRAREAIAALRRRMTETVPEDERAEAERIWNDPHWSYLGTSVTWQFVLIGPGDFVTSITPADRVRVDLALTFLGDLVGRDQVADAGERLTIYYKERFDFGGGLGGGHRIDIGNKVITKPIANALHYHEMSHCVFDVGIAYPGFTEGIANFGATFALDAMGRHAEADASIASNRKGYKEDYLERRVRFWRIAPYAPSCGFLLTPITQGDPVARQAQWAKYRRFFRLVRHEMPREPRDAERIRYFTWFWGKAFGWTMFDETAKARFPVVPGDREQVDGELARWYDLVARGESYADQEFFGAAVEPLDEVIAKCPPGELRDRAKFALARVKEGLGDPAARDALHRELGVVGAWKLCLPFYSRGVSPLLTVHEPEREIVLGAEYPNPMQTARWRDANPTVDGRVDLLQYGVGYPDDAACYALAVLEVSKDVPDAVCFLGFDDTCALWVNGELAEKWEDASGWLRDDRVAAVPLKAGRNRLLLKVVNRTGAWGFSARVVHADRTPIEGLVLAPPPEKDVAPPVPEAKGHPVHTLDVEKMKSLPKGRVKATVGAFDVVNKALRCTVPGSVPWRKYQISPFVSKDPPIALCWLADKDLLGLADFVVEVTTHRADLGVPRFGVTLHGEEKDDGLSGHTFVVRGGGDGVEARLEEYERPVFHGSAKVARGPVHVFRFVRRGRTLSAYCDGVAMLEAVDLPALARPGIGLMVWDKETGFSKVRVEKLGK